METWYNGFSQYEQNALEEYFQRLCLAAMYAGWHWKNDKSLDTGVTTAILLGKVNVWNHDIEEILRDTLWWKAVCGNEIIHNKYYCTCAGRTKGRQCEAAWSYWSRRFIGYCPCKKIETLKHLCATKPKNQYSREYPLPDLSPAVFKVPKF